MRHLFIPSHRLTVRHVSGAQETIDVMRYGGDRLYTRAEWESDAAAVDWTINADGVLFQGGTHPSIESLTVTPVPAAIPAAPATAPPKISMVSARNAVAAALAHHRDPRKLRDEAFARLIGRSRARRRANEQLPWWRDYALERLEKARREFQWALRESFR